MSIFLDSDTKVIVQGITGKMARFHTNDMIKYGTNVVGGVVPGKGGETVEGVPVFNTVKEAVAETGAEATLVFVPPPSAADSIMEAADAGIRYCVCITDGIPAQETGTIDAPIARLGVGTRRAVREDGQHAVTHYRVIQTSGNHALIRLRLETGRTHQIRVHLAHIGCPITGDYLYGTEHPALPGRFALHSAHICLTHPITGKRIELDEPLPDALAAALNEQTPAIK